MEYLTPDDYEIAKKNGISGERAKARFYKMGWIKERAITQEVKSKGTLWTKYKEVSQVALPTFYNRIKKGMTPEEAALTPPLPLGGRLDRPMKITKEHTERAAKNGIKATTLCYRVYRYGWDVERACTEPIDKRKRSKKLDRTIKLSTN